MKAAVAFMLFAVSAFAFAQDQSSIQSAQAACGPSPAKFDVSETKPETKKVLPDSDPARALVYVIEEQKFKAVRDVTARFAVDGQWVGANRGNSYFFFFADPSEHHLCVDWISDHVRNGRLVSLNHFTARAGETYYFRIRTSGSPNVVDGATLDLDAINSDEGKLLVASSALAKSHPKK